MINNDSFTVNEIFRKVNAFLKTADTIKITNLEKLRSVQRIKENAYNKEFDRLKGKLGEDHPRVKSIASKRNYTHIVVKGLDFRIQKERMKQPKYDKNAWKVHGFVFDHSLKGVPGLGVTFCDENKNLLKEFGYTCTNAKGYFLIKYKSGSKAAAPPPTHPPPPTHLFLCVIDANKRIIYKDTAPLVIETGKIVYREIYLTGKEVPCPFDETDDQPPGDDEWIVKGTISDEQGKRMAGLTVSLSDKEEEFKDILGAAKTTKAGDYEFCYPAAKLSGIIKKNPAIYIKVFDKSGKVVYTSTRALKCEIGKTKVKNITIKKSRKKGGSKDADKGTKKTT